MLVALRRDGAVQHGFEKTAHGGQGRAEIVGDIGDKFFLVVIRAGDGVRHIAQRSCEIAQFILPLHRNAVVHVAERILLRL